MLAKDGAILADDPEKYLSYSEEAPYIDENTGKTTHKTLVYDYDDGKQHYRVTYRQEGSLAYEKMTAAMPWWQKTAARIFMELDPSYHRLFGHATLERIEGTIIAETVTAPAIWEQMYFGIDRP